ncbi:hypothetical protein HETIRDRAFT_425964 [Heterobasidion irregulare TC 32-1]|uniref:Uncharacterized protein n=1 Tax=Heterobasidion irregulare (strain TC 32-1) TaxID=747525 RepID=W4KFV8_HETIT|nr:uncharacterized protein HETIRDRAFT_425964 [Heterobasidion irregulare TC 32-1]ETW84728.1 hypothetical protein HETIRDRAFT_425964 [Heterobasidion irregulare TC 32-1]
MIASVGMELKSVFTHNPQLSLVAGTLQQHRQCIKEKLGQGNSKTRVAKIMALLVESGGLYCNFWGIYPTGVLVLVSLEKTMWDSRDSVVGYIDGNTTHLEFAPGPGIVSKNTASRHQIGTIQLDTEMQAVEFDRDAYMDSIESEV